MCIAIARQIRMVARERLRSDMPFLRERSGRWSPEKIIAFVGACLPALYLAWQAWNGELNPARPVTEAIHDAGSWAVRFLLISLAVTPARRLFAAPKLINMRRTLGVAAFCYAALHFSLYIADQKFNLAKVASEIALRFYLTIGFVALTGLIALAVTSSDGMIRRLGAARWNALHNIVYPVAILGIIHFLLQTKIDITESIMVAGFLFWLFGYRLLHRYAGDVTPARSLALSVAAAALTAGAEALWYASMTGVAAWRVFSVNLDWDMGPRPAHWVLIAGLAVTLASFLWSLKTQRPKARKTSARASVGAIQVQSGS
jgi:sulfoxide reductase heme-binding subunit YedZ